MIALVAFPLAFGTVSTHLANTAGDGEEPPTEESAPYDDVLVRPARPDAAPAAATSSRSTADGRVGVIPWTALQSYHRAAGILAEVQPSCGLTWTLIAAVGQTESDHGQAGGHDLGDDGTVRPVMVGPALDGRQGRVRVADTDAGRFDGDSVWDREVGPMRLLPSVWALAGVDGDGDGKRNAHDLDDAALSTAVYLCAGADGLDKAPNAAAALLAYRGDEAYVARVLMIDKRYREGSFAVAATPPMSTIGITLDYGVGAPVRERTADAVREVERHIERVAEAADAGLDVVAPETDTEARPPRTRSPEAAPAPGELPTPAEQPIIGAPDTPDGFGPDAEPTPPEAPALAAPQVPAAPPPDSGGGGVAPEPVDPPAADPGTDDPVEDPADDPTDVPADTPADDPDGTPADGDTPGDDPPAADPPADPPAADPPADEPRVDEPTDQAPAPSDDPTTELVEGLWTACEQGDPPVGGYCLDDARVDLGLSGPLDAPATADLDGDGSIGTVKAELEGLLGRIVKLTVVLGSRPLRVVAVNDMVMVAR